MVNLQNYVFYIYIFNCIIKDFKIVIMVIDLWNRYSNPAGRMQQIIWPFLVSSL